MEVAFAVMSMMLLFILMFGMMDVMLLEEVLPKNKIGVVVIVTATIGYNIISAKYLTASLETVLLLMICFKRVRADLCSNGTVSRPCILKGISTVILLISIGAYVESITRVIGSVHRLFSDIIGRL